MNPIPLHMWVTKAFDYNNQGEVDEKTRLHVSIGDDDKILFTGYVNPNSIGQFIGANPENGDVYGARPDSFLLAAVQHHILTGKDMDSLLAEYDTFVVNGQTFEKKKVTKYIFVPGV